MFSQAARETAREILKQPLLTTELEKMNGGSNEQDNNIMEEDDDQEGEAEEQQRTSSSTQPLSRLQQLRQKKRLLEALPASISTAAAPIDAPDQLMEDSNIRSCTPPRIRPSNNLARIAIASAAVFESTELVQQEQQQQQQQDDHSSNASTLSTQMSEMDLEEKEETTVSSTAFQESLTITPGTKNPISSEDETSTPFDGEAQQKHALEEEQAKPTQKRRRMLGLDFLPTSKRFPKRRNTGNDGHQ